MTDVAVITGGASGFGRALGERCAERGMHVVLLDLDGDRAEQEAFEAMHASNPDLARDVTTPEGASRRVIDAVLAGERYVVTHGDPVDPVAARCRQLHRAAERATDVGREGTGL